MKHPVPESSPELEQARVIERPDGFYWQASDGAREYGPYPTRREALDDIQQAEDSLFEPGETAEEAKAEIGIADWLDPDTGEPAEEDGTRIEEH